MKETEIEFKNMLTQNEYTKLLTHFAVAAEDIITLRNDYFDTPALAIKDLHSALRIRQTTHYIECTLKQATSKHTSTEINVPLTATQANQLRNDLTLLPKAIATPLQTKGVILASIACFGTLETHRVELPYKGGLLVFDHTFYLQQEDYEVEYEAEDEQLGQKIFADFLQQHQLPVRPATKKIARFSAALDAQKGQN